MKKVWMLEFLCFVIVLVLGNSVEGAVYTSKTFPSDELIRKGLITLESHRAVMSSADRDTYPVINLLGKYKNSNDQYSVYLTSSERGGFSITIFKLDTDVWILEEPGAGWTTLAI